MIHIGHYLAISNHFAYKFKTVYVFPIKYVVTGVQNPSSAGFFGWICCCRVHGSIFSPFLVIFRKAQAEILLMEEILHQLGCMKPYKKWDKLHINWCRISSINSISGHVRSNMKPNPKCQSYLHNSHQKDPLHSRNLPFFVQESVVHSNLPMVSICKSHNVKAFLDRQKRISGGLRHHNPETSPPSAMPWWAMTWYTWSTTRWAKKSTFSHLKNGKQWFCPQGPWEDTVETFPKTSHFERNSERETVGETSGVSSRGIWVRSQNGGWKTIRLPFGFRYIFRGELLNFQVGISVGCPHVTARFLGGERVKEVQWSLFFKTILGGPSLEHSRLPNCTKIWSFRLTECFRAFS